MQTGRPKAPLTLTAEEQQKLQTWARRATSSQRLALRARIILACVNETLNQDVAQGDCTISHVPSRTCSR